MEIFDLMQLQADSYENRKVNVFYQNDLFKTRIIVLNPGDKIPECEMKTYVMFYVVKGKILLKKNNEISEMNEGMLFISEPALLSMETKEGARILGIQVSS